MAIQVSDLIEAQHYNDLALEINRLFSDTTPGIIWDANRILNTTAAPGGELAGATRTLSPAPSNGDYLVVLINGFTQPPENYSINYITGEITYLVSLSASAILQVYNRTTHRYGWGQQASVYPISAGELIRADEATLQAYIEANTNNLVDKVNIMEDRTGGPSQLTRFNQGELIRAADKLSIQSAINNDILSGSNYWNNELATVSASFESFSRTTDWNNILVGAWSYTWPSFDSFRYFFNSGCQMRLYLEITGDDSLQAVWNWGQVVTNMGTLILNYDTCSQTGINGTSENLGAYDLSTTWQTIFTSDGPTAPRDETGEYVTGEYVIEADIKIVWSARIQTIASGETTIEIAATLDDNDVNTTFVGTLAFYAGYLLADDVTNNSATFSMTANAPTITILDDFESFNDS